MAEAVVAEGVPGGTAATRDDTDQLTALWQRKAGLLGWVMAVNHKQVGLRFIVTAFIFFLIGGIQALLIRIQLARAENDFLGADTYNDIFTMHGTTMMFLFAIPLVEGFGMYLVPLMIGTRDMAFPRLNAFGYWVYVLAGATLYFALFTGNPPDDGWFAYVPLTTEEYSPGLGMDYWTTAITFLEISALVAAVELIVTIFKMRAPGMSLNRMPLFVWAILVTAFMILFAMPAVMLASVMLALDRFVGTDFFNPVFGGAPLLWQHLFWVFGHPEVYIIAVPGFGIISTLVATFSRRTNAAYTLVALSLVAIGFISFGLWVHHMFTTGLPTLGMAFFAAASFLVVIPSGIQIFSWIVTMFRGTVVMALPMLFVLGFFFIFVLGGITGVMVAAAPFDWQVHDTYFVVAHFHYVLIGALVFPMFGAFYYWLPKITGRLMDTRVGLVNFWLVFIGFNVTFFPMHFLGLVGMPRRVYTYQSSLGWESLNLLQTIGAFVLAIGVLAFIVNFFWSLSSGEPSGRNPWGANTLEWAIPSPPPAYNFRSIPVVENRDPLWAQPEMDTENPRGSAYSVPLPDAETGRRETLGTSLLDATIERRVILPGPSIAPLLTAVAVGVVFLGPLVSLYLVPVGAVLAAVTIIGWLWPSKEDRQR